MIDEEIKELEDKIKALKKKKSEERESKKCLNIIYTKEYGWVKKLPCGPGDEAYSFECVERYNDKYAGRDRTISQKAWTQSSLSFIDRRIMKEGMKVWLVKIHMKPQWIDYVGKTIWLTKSEAEQHLRDLGYTGEYRYREE